MIEGTEYEDSRMIARLGGNFVSDGRARASVVEKQQYRLFIVSNCQRG